MVLLLSAQQLTTVWYSALVSWLIFGCVVLETGEEMEIDPFCKNRFNGHETTSNNTASENRKASETFAFPVE